MTRQEFLAKLRQALESELDHRTVQENVDYYNSYVIEETAKGRSESDVIAELGDPWVIARSVIGMSGDGQRAQTVYETASGRGQENKSRGKNDGSFVFGAWWKTVLLVLGVIGVFLLVIAVIGGIFSLLMPILVPVLVILLIIRLINGVRR